MDFNLEMIEVVEGEYANENPKYIAEETAKRYIALYNKMVKESLDGILEDQDLSRYIL